MATAGATELQNGSSSQICSVINIDKVFVWNGFPEVFSQFSQLITREKNEEKTKGEKTRRQESFEASEGDRALGSRRELSDWLVFRRVVYYE